MRRGRRRSPGPVGRPGRPRRVDEKALARERAFLGALVLQPEAILWVASRRPPWSFLHPKHIDVMQALVCLARGRKAVNIGSVVAMLEHHEALIRVGGEAYVTTLINPGGELDEARSRVRARFQPIDREPVVGFARRVLEGKDGDMDGGRRGVGEQDEPSGEGD